MSMSVDPALPLILRNSPHLKAKTIRDGIVAVIGATIFVGVTVIALTMDYSPIRAKFYAFFAEVVRVLKVYTTG